MVGWLVLETDGESNETSMGINRKRGSIGVKTSSPPSVSYIPPASAIGDPMQGRRGIRKIKEKTVLRREDPREERWKEFLTPRE